MQNIFGQNLLNRRKALRLTQEQLAAKLKVSFQAVSKWERGETLPDIKLLPMLASQLGTSADSLLGYEGAAPATIYEERYRTQELYWGGEPNEMRYFTAAAANASAESAGHRLRRRQGYAVFSALRLFNNRF